MPPDLHDTDDYMPMSLQEHVGRNHFVVNPLVLGDDIAVRSPYMRQTGP